MPRNSEGQYTLPAPFANAGAVASSTTVNNNGTDIASELTDSLSRSGKGGMQTHLKMGGNKILNVAAGEGDTDGTNLKQLNDAKSELNQNIVAASYRQAATVGGTADAVTLTFSPVFTAYATGQRIRWVANGPNTIAAPTVNVDGLGARTIRKMNGLALIPGDIPGSGAIVDVAYNGTDFTLLNPVTEPETVFTAASVAGTVDAITVTLNNPITSYATGLLIRFTSAGTNTATTMTVNVDGKGTRPIKRADGTDYPIGTFPATGQTVTLRFDGTNFVPAGIMSSSIADSGATGRAVLTAADAAAARAALGAAPAYTFTSLIPASGTAVLVTGIPTNARELIVVYDGVSHNSATAQAFRARMGTSAGVQSSGYTDLSFTAQNGFLFFNMTSADFVIGGCSFLMVGSNRWVRTNGSTSSDGGGVTLSSVLDRIEFSWASGASFDAGNILVGWR